MTTPILDIRNLYFSYSNTTVLENINLTVYAGNKLVIIGPNGGGKSTLLYCIAGIVNPSSGTIQYSFTPHTPSVTEYSLFARLFKKNCVPATSSPMHGISGSIGYVPQYPTHNSTMLISVLDVVLLGKTQLFARTYTKKENKEYARYLLSLVGLNAKETMLFSSLSGGEKQRVLLARALLSKPALLLLDEPTASIDPKSRFCFYELLAQLDDTITILMTTHDINAIDSSFTALATVDKTLHLYNSVQMNQNILHTLYGKHHNHLCGIGSFMDKMLPQE